MDSNNGLRSHWITAQRQARILLFTFQYQHINITIKQTPLWQHHPHQCQQAEQQLKEGNPLRGRQLKEWLQPDTWGSQLQQMHKAQFNPHTEGLLAQLQ